MTRSIPVLLLTLASASLAQAAGSMPSAPPEQVPVEAKRPGGMSFQDLASLQVGATTFLYKPAITDVVFDGKGPDENGPVVVLRTALDGGAARNVVVTCVAGIEDDDRVVLSRVAPAGDQELLTLVRPTTVILPGTGAVYVETRAQVDPVTTNRKYALTNGKLVEVKQPFDYIGLRTTVHATACASAPYTGPDKLTLLAEKDAKAKPVAVLPMGANIDVVLREGEWYLVRSDFGLLGWVRLPKNALQSNFGLAWNACAG